MPPKSPKSPRTTKKSPVMDTEQRLAEEKRMRSQATKRRKQEAKQELEEEIRNILAAISSLSDMSLALGASNTNKPVYYSFKVDGNERSGVITKADLTKFRKEISQRVQHLPVLMRKQHKGLRKDGTQGFKNIAKYNDEICEFFRTAKLGNAVEGDIVMKESKKGGQPKEALENYTVTNTPLNDYLYFTQRKIGNTNNPAYGWFVQTGLASLFSLHLYYSNPNAKRVKGENFRTTTQMNSSLKSLISQVSNQTTVDSNGRTVSKFDPSDFKFNNITNLVTAAKIQDAPRPSDTEIRRVFGDIVEVKNAPEGHALEALIQHQDGYVKRAKRYQELLKSKKESPSPKTSPSRKSPKTSAKSSPKTSSKSSPKTSAKSSPKKRTSRKNSS